jgi:hypothetical protein
MWVGMASTASGIKAKCDMANPIDFSKFVRCNITLNARVLSLDACLSSRRRMLVSFSGSKSRHAIAAFANANFALAA